MRKDTLRIGAIFFCFIVFVSDIECNPVPPAKAVSNGIKYLKRYGYLVDNDPRTGAMRTQAELEESIKRLQRYAGLRETGQLDAATVKLMTLDRCGVPDFSRSDKARRRRRYALQGSKWNKKDITFKILGRTNRLSEQDQRATFIKAFKMWEAVSQLNIRETKDEKADILIDFKRGYHNDGYPFDGPEGTLAHAFYPHDNKGIAGDAHFDDDEPWTLGSHSGVNLEWVAIHEFGHSLGLGHSRIRETIMYPWYKGYSKNITLTEDDIRGIQRLYGRRVSPTERPTTSLTSQPKSNRSLPTRDPSAPDPCVTSFDTFFTDAADKTYAFKGQYYWIIGRNAGVESGPHKIVLRWRELVNPVNASYTRKDGSTIFFTGSEYYQYYGNRLVRGPTPIEHYGLPANLSNMDAAFIWGGNGRTYFFKGDQYWRYDDRVNKVDLDYPKKISFSWTHVPNNIDAAMQWLDGMTYIFKGTKCYKIDDWSIQVAAGYPKVTGYEWIKCSESDVKKSVEPANKGSTVFDPTNLLRAILVGSLLSILNRIVL